MTADSGSGLARLNALPDDEARRVLSACCATAGWTQAVVAGRPYSDRSALQARAAAELAALDWAGVREALEAHPRIGERVAVTAQSGPEAAWSVSEQSGMDTATPDTRADLVSPHRADEERVRHVFLILAACPN